MMSIQRKRPISMVMIGGVLIVFAVVTGALTSDAQSEIETNATSEIAHGRYLVHNVAQCVVCHTPRREQGELIQTRLLSGAVIPVRSPDEAEPWAFHSASIAGLTTFSSEHVIHLLTTGERPNGTQPKLPMPRFGMTQEDAKAVVAYLRSL